MADITAETIDRILKLAPHEEITTADGRVLVTKGWTPLAPPVPAPLQVHSLSALIGLYTANFEGVANDLESPVFHVESHDQVSVYGLKSNIYGERQKYAVAKLPPFQMFPFGQFQNQANFIIGVQSLFFDYGERAKILKLASSLATEDKLQIEDNGISQTATAKAGIARVETLDISPIVVLKPYRTFLDVEQPPSTFLIRVKKDGNGLPSLALFEADGGRWKIDAAYNIQQYLAEKLNDSSATVVS